ncbi:tetratricopeptide repeat-containing protein [Mycena vulgaris]|nr:tetratricopeptide repeat-containing protein [Mycena vulgaris]
MYTLRLGIVELVSWLVDPPEEQASNATDQGTQQETEILYIEIDRGGREFIRASTLNAEFSFEWNFLPNISPDPMSEVIILRLYYESSLLEENDRVLLANCHFIVGELLKACWSRDKAGKDEVCAKLSANLSISPKFRVDPQNLDKEIEHHRKALHLRATPHPERGVTLYNLANALQTRFIQQGDDVDNDAAIEYYRAAAQDAFAPRHPAGFLEKLASALHMRFEQRENLKDINEAIGVTNELLEANPEHRGINLINLAHFLQVRFEHQPVGDPNDIEKIIMLLREALALQDTTHVRRSMALNDLGAALRIRFVMREDLNDLEDAVKFHREALAINSSPISHPRRVDILPNLAFAVNIRFQQYGDPEDLNELIELWREELELTDQHPKRWKSLENLGGVLEVRFDQRGDPNDLDESIEIRKEALQLYSFPDSNRSKILRGVALSLRNRFEHRENVSDLDDAIGLSREDLANCPPLDLGHCLRNLAYFVQMRFDHQSDAKDINEAIELYRRVLVLDSPAHNDDKTILNNLSAAIQSRFHQQGNPGDIDEAIELCRKSVELCSVSQPKRTTLLVNLGMALRIRFNQRGDARDLDEAVELHRQALQSHATHDPDHSIVLSNLADVLQLRFRERRRQRDIDEAIGLYGEAIKSRSRHYQNRSIVIHNLAHALELRFQTGKDLDDINNAIDHFKQALELRMPPNPRRRSSLNGLATALADRFIQYHDAQDIDEAIELCQEALNSCPNPHPDRVIHLRNLGNCIFYGAELRESRMDAMEMSISKLREASTCTYSAALDRFSAAVAWTKWATEYKHSSALDAYRTRIHMLPELAALSLNLKSRQQVLTKEEITSLSATSASFAINLDKPNVAVEFLEASRSIFWSQALNLRSPVDKLANVRSDLAMNLRALSRQLEQASFRETSEDFSTATQSQLISAEAETTRCRKVNEDWEETIKAVRRLPGFEDFLYPKSIVSLRRAALSGPVVILLANGSSSSALIVKPSEDVRHVPLPAINIEELELYSLLPRAISNRNPDIFKDENNKYLTVDSTARLYAAREDFINKSPDDILRIHLAELWNNLVKPVFGALNLQKSEHPPRLWWCPTGMFAFLPIHAAGIYDANGTDCVSDYVVSSYTPTLAALLNRPAVAKTAFKMTAIIEPNAPDCSPLPGTARELANIAKRVPKEWLTAIHNGTGGEVMKHLQESSVAHFACHGIQDRMNPLDSGLMLSDGRLKVSRIMQQPENEESRKAMSLAFLSACETAKGDNSTPDESMHLAATLLFAGFHAVVATMWTMYDSDGPKVADTFYEYLFKDCKPDTNSPVTPDLQKAAEALHFAVAKLRKEPGMSFKRWVPFVHYGL